MQQKSVFLFVVLFISIHFNAQGQILKGKVTDIKSQPIADAFVHILNTNAETYTDAKGNFLFRKLPVGKYLVVVSAIGYASSETEVLLNGKAGEINIQLANASIQLDEVVVSAEKKEESPLHIPASITTISSGQVQEYRLWDTKDITAIVPNLFSNNSGDDRNVTSIRGIVNTSYDPAVATYIDGVNQFSLDTYIGVLDDVERIEILRGPQGTLYGRNAMGGVINIITKQPTNITNGYAVIDFGNYGQQRYNAGIRLPIVKDKLFFGAAAMFSKRNGFYTNDFNNNSFDKQQGITGNYYIRFRPDDKWDIMLNVKHQINRNDGAFPMVADINDAFSNPYHLDQNAVAKMIDNTVNTSLSIKLSGTSFNFASLTAWQQNHRYYNAPLDGDFSPADAVTIINNYGKKWNNVKVLTQEFRFSSPAGNSSPFKWNAGTYFFYQDNPSKQATHFGDDAALLGAPDTDFSTINSSTGKNSGIAVYGQLTYSLNKRLDLVTGLRYDYENRKLDVEGEYQKDGQSTFVTQPDTSASLRFSAVSPKLGLSYKISSKSNFYITYSRGYRTGGLTQLSSDPSQPPLYPYKPEYSNNYEAGAKNTFGNNRVRLNAAVFITAVNDVQVPTLILPDAITVVKNTGKLTSKGFEFDLSADPVKGLRIDYSFGYTNAKYTSLKVSQNGQSVDLKGSKQIFTPAFTSMLAIQYSYNIRSENNSKLILRAEWKSLGTEYFDLANTIKQSSYSLINLREGYSSKHFDIFLWGRNTGNKKYIAYAYDFGAIHLGDPATYGVTLILKF
ncbi:MAG TPA: TonB-dependent receptor [Chitinophagaceae bacterium]|nr:TonB-dependent receptor [Chitinophagaceae bacterium]